MSESTSSAPASPKADKFKGSLAQLSSLQPTFPTTRSGRGRDVLLYLIASRLLNALVIQTFFQPDEYFQALEPAWQLAFGSGAGAWITWVRLFPNTMRHRFADLAHRNGRTICAPQSILRFLPSATKPRTASLASYHWLVASGPSCCL